MKGKAFLFSALLGLMVMFGSCDNEVTSTALVVDESKTAVFKLYVKAELDADSDGTEYVPDGTEFIISVKKDTLNGNFTGDDRWVTNATTTGGALEVNVPATVDGINVWVDAIGFEYTYEVNDSTTEKRFYDYSEALGGVKTGTNNVFSITMKPGDSPLETIID